MLYESFHSLKKKASPGVDGVTYEDYQKHLDEKLRSLHQRLIAKRYRAQSVKRRYIPKVGSNKLRPLGNPLIRRQNRATRREPASWKASSNKTSAIEASATGKANPEREQAGRQLTQDLDSGTYRWIVEADIRSFFDDVDHKPGSCAC